jgi:glycosyltransferase involved in cell wall biosynthesis
VKIAVVVQRYGLDINGGAELHARYVAEHLSRHAEVEVLTTCAHNYISWRNDLPAGREQLNGIPVHRFPVSRERVVNQFARASTRVFEQPHSLAAELAWLDAEGPTSPALIRHIQQNQGHYDYFIFFSFRYYHAYHGIRAAPDRSLLVPTAEREGAVGLSMFTSTFRSVRALMYNSFEERAMIQAVSGNHDVPHVVVGIGSDVPSETRPEQFRQHYGIQSPFVVYVGRIDENKGCKELFAYFQRYTGAVGSDLMLVLMGTTILPIPDHPRIRHLGFVSDEDKFNAIAASEALIMPSYFESLSMVALEAWALGRPVLANGRCDVLTGQCLRSNGGLYYTTYQEFRETLHLIESNRPLAHALGDNGRAFYLRHYDWPVIERKYLDMLTRLQQADLAGRTPARVEPLPGWMARRRVNCRPANDVVRDLPSGAVVPKEARA